MKNFLLGMLTLLTISVVNQAVWMHTCSQQGKSKLHEVSWFIDDVVFHGSYVLNPLTGRCSTKRYARADETLLVADYFGCDKFQRLINLESKE